MWELLNAILATFLPQWGASMVGWNPKFGWSSDIFAMSAQYGMGMFLLGFVYLLVASDPVRYRVFVWVAVAEHTDYFFSFHSLKLLKYSDKVVE